MGTHIAAGTRIGICAITLAGYAWLSRLNGTLSWLSTLELLSLGAMLLGLSAWTRRALTDQGLSDTTCRWVSLALGGALIWDPASRWATTSAQPEVIAALLWTGTLGLIDHIEEIRSRARSGSGALLRGTGDAGPTENLTLPSYWGVAILMAAAFWVLPEAILLIPGLIAGLKRRSAWGAVAWRLLIATGIPTLLMSAESRAAQLERFRDVFRLWTVPGTNDIQSFFPPGEATRTFPEGIERGLLLLIFVLLTFHTAREIAGMVRAFRTTPEAVAWDRPGSRQNQFLAACSAFLLVFSLAKSETSAFGHLLLWPAVAVTLSRLSSLRMPRWTAVLAALTCGFAVLTGLLFVVHFFFQ